MDHIDTRYSHPVDTPTSVLRPRSSCSPSSCSANLSRPRPLTPPFRNLLPEKRQRPDLTLKHALHVLKSVGSTGSTVPPPPPLPHKFSVCATSILYVLLKTVPPPPPQIKNLSYASGVNGRVFITVNFHARLVAHKTLYYTDQSAMQGSRS